MKYTEDFLEFWKKYPARWNRDSDRHYKVGKWEAMCEWKKLSQHEKEDCLGKVKYVQGGQYVLDAHRWLKKKRFDDIDIKVKHESLPTNIVPIMKIVPEGDRSSTSDKANKARRKLGDL